MFNKLKKETFVNNDRGFEKFCDMSIKHLHKHDLIKNKYKRSNRMPFVKKIFLERLLKNRNLEITIYNKKMMQTECYTRSKETTVHTF